MRMLEEVDLRYLRGQARVVKAEVMLILQRMKIKIMRMRNLIECVREIRWYRAVSFG